jgi:uncharacterized membrane protein YsdA (DUF1294 family)
LTDLQYISAQITVDRFGSRRVLLQEYGLYLGMLALVMINLWTMIAFWEDKQCAIAGRRRTPEATLLNLAAIGGSPGAFLARHLFRHKTRKEPFSTCLQVIAVIQAGLLIGFFLW